MIIADMIYCHIRILLYRHYERHVEGVEETVDAHLPLILIAYVVLTPCAAEIISVLLVGLDVLNYAKSMSGDGTLGLVVEKLPALGAIGEQGCHVELETVTLGLVGGVGILYVVLPYDHALGIGGMDYNPGSKVAWRGESRVPYGHLVEVGAFVKADDAVLNNILVVLDLHGIVRKLYGEAQWSVVEKLIGCPAIGEADVVAIDDGGSTATECWTHLIAVETVSAIHMITQFVDKLVVITVFHHEVGGVLHPHVIAIGILARALQGRTIAAIGTTVVLPCYVIHTLGIHSAVASIDV